MKGISTNSKDTLWLIGFYLDPDAERPDIYTLFRPGDEDKPLVSGGYVVFFSELALAPKAAELCDVQITTPVSLFAEDVDLECYVAESLYLINSQDTDSSATIVNFLNTLFDLVKATQLPMPAEYKRVLYAFADHLTFNREFSTFFAQQSISRSMITNAILWCIGAVVAKSKLLTCAE